MERVTRLVYIFALGENYSFPRSSPHEQRSSALHLIFRASFQIKNHDDCRGLLYGAGDEARTRYLHLGKVALYRMSYTRRNMRYYNIIFRNVNTLFLRKSGRVSPARLFFSKGVLAMLCKAVTQHLMGFLQNDEGPRINLHNQFLQLVELLAFQGYQHHLSVLPGVIPLAV